MQNKRTGRQVARVLAVIGFAAVVSAAGIANAAPGRTTGAVNLRTGPSTAYSRITTIPAGALIDILYCSGWCRVSWQGYEGWVAGSYVAAADGQRPQVVVPDYPVGGGYEGCYRITELIYGPYRLSFCLGSVRGNSYTVVGGGIDCRGRLDWSEGSSGIQINLARTSCGGGIAWSADTLRCNFSGPTRPPSVFDELRPNVVIPDRPDRPVRADELTCRYFPAAPGFSVITVTARRTR